MTPTPAMLPPACGWCQHPETVGGLALAMIGVVLLATLLLWREG